jgi:transcriptional regulator
MHPARLFHVTDSAILRQRLLEHPFAVISAVSDGQPVAAHAPILPYSKGLPSGEGGP